MQISLRWPSSSKELRLTKTKNLSSSDQRLTLRTIQAPGNKSLRWRHNGCDSVSNHQPHHCLLNRLFRRRSKITSKLRVTGLCAVNSPGTGEFSAQMASNAEKVSIWWRHHVIAILITTKRNGKNKLYPKRKYTYEIPPTLNLQWHTNSCN